MKFGYLDFKDFQNLQKFLNLVIFFRIKPILNEIEKMFNKNPEGPDIITKNLNLFEIIQEI